jgi:hypothetical protein
MTTDTMAMFGVFVAMTEMTRKPTAVVPEPEFARFKFPERKAAVRAAGLAPANDPATPDTGVRAA